MESLRASRLCVRNLASVDYLFLNLLASLNLLDVTQLVNDNATFACDPSCFRTRALRFRDPADSGRPADFGTARPDFRLLERLRKGSHGIFASFAPLREKSCFR